MASEEEDGGGEDVPLHRMRPFGSGLHRKKIAFVRASSGDLKTTATAAPDGAPGTSVGDLYLSIVMPKGQSAEQGDTAAAAATGVGEEVPAAPVEVCEICKLPLASAASGTAAGEQGGAGQPRRHEASLVHQVCLAHSHPPSAVDRSRLGLSVLESQGWDPDARRGLGAEGQGIQFPLKPAPKDDKLGLGLAAPKDFLAARKREKEQRPQKLDAKKVRKMDVEDRKRTEKLRRQIFGNVDLDKYLGSGSGSGSDG